MKYTEEAIVFSCTGCRLIGIYTHPETAAETGVLIVVGGPQYRAGSHRQFTLLARELAGQGIPSMRFDHRGMGDSEGNLRNFEALDDDIRTAIDIFFKHVSDLRSVVLWGLCDAASAALYYGHTDKRVIGLILLNPWVHTEVSASHARLRYYYLTRLLQRSFWIKLMSGKVDLSDSVGDLKISAHRVITGASHVASVPAYPGHGRPGYIERMYEGLKSFQGKVLFILSGSDLTAKEFISLTKHDKYWRKLCNSSNIAIEIVNKANHTFSTLLWRDVVAKLSITWLKNLPEGKETSKK